MNIIKATKKNLIGQANSMIFIAAIIGSVSVSVGAVSGKLLLDRHGFQSRVMKAKREARDTLKSNVDGLEKLKTSLIQQDQTSTNSQVILEALPSKYDFPAVASSIEFIAQKGGQDMSKFRFTGKDEGGAPAEDSVTPAPYPMPFETTVKGSDVKTLQFLLDMERSIRPIKLNTLEIKGDEVGIALNITAQTYYQPTKNLKSTTKEIK